MLSMLGARWRTAILVPVPYLPATTVSAQLNMVREALGATSCAPRGGWSASILVTFLVSGEKVELELLW